MRVLTLFIALAIAIFTAGAASPLATAQKQTPSATKHPFEPAEQLFYEAEFSRSILRKLDVADFKFSAGRGPLNELSGTGEAAPYTLVFKAEIASKGFFT